MVLSNIDFGTCPISCILTRQFWFCHVDFALLIILTKKCHCCSKFEMLKSQYLSGPPFAKASQQILAFWNAFQNGCKWFLKYLHFICARLKNLQHIHSARGAQIWIK